MAQFGKGASGCNDGGQDRSRWLESIQTSRQYNKRRCLGSVNIGGKETLAYYHHWGGPMHDQSIEVKVQDCLVGGGARHASVEAV